jgi:hypothetical protein
MSTMPSLDLLRRSIGLEFHLEDAQRGATPVILHAAYEGVPMTDRHACYAAVFLLPAGIRASQGIYRIRHPQGQAWELFLVPIAPSPDGRHRLEATVHCEAAWPPIALASSVAT